MKYAVIRNPFGNWEIVHAKNEHKGKGKFFDDLHKAKKHRDKMNKLETNK